MANEFFSTTAANCGCSYGTIDNETTDCCNAIMNVLFLYREFDTLRLD